MTRLLVAPIVLGGMLCGIGSANAADISFSPTAAGQFALAKQKHISVSGEIVEGDVERLRDLLDTHATNPRYPLMVHLDSPGGSVVVALEMGKLIRKKSASTIVFDGAICASSCVFLLAAGVDRWVIDGAQIGLHRPRFDYATFASLSKQDAEIKYQAAVRGCQSYMREMGVSDQIFSDMLRIRSQDVEFVDRDYAEKYGLVGKDPGWEEWVRAKNVEEKGEHVVHAEDRNERCLNEMYASGGDMDTCTAQFKEDLRQLKQARNAEFPK